MGGGGGGGVMSFCHFLIMPHLFSSVIRSMGQNVEWKNHETGLDVYWAKMVDMSHRLNVWPFR